MVLTCRLCGVVALSDSFVIPLETVTRKTTYAELLKKHCPTKLQSDSQRSQHMCKTCKTGIDNFMLVCDNFEENELQPIEEILEAQIKKERRESIPAVEQIHREPVRSSHRLNSNEKYRTLDQTEMEACFVSLERLHVVFVDTDDSDSDSGEAVVEDIKPVKARKRMREDSDEYRGRSKSRKENKTVAAPVPVAKKAGKKAVVEPKKTVVEPKKAIAEPAKVVPVATIKKRARKQAAFEKEAEEVEIVAVTSKKAPAPVTSKKTPAPVTTKKAPAEKSKPVKEKKAVPAVKKPESPVIKVKPGKKTPAKAKIAAKTPTASVPESSPKHKIVKGKKAPPASRSKSRKVKQEHQ